MDTPQEQLFDLNAQRNELARSLEGSQDLDQLVSQIYLDDPSTILSFGADAAKEISRCSDTILHSVSMGRTSDPTPLLTDLSALMGRFDVDEIAGEERRGLFSRLLGGGKETVEQVLARYRTLGDEVDRIYVRLKQLEAELEQTNRQLEEIFTANLAYYKDLVRYILAGEEGLRQVDAYLEQKRQETAAHPGDHLLAMECASVQQARNLLDQRVQDLRIAEVVAMQALPMVKSMEYTNLNLMRKLNSAFLVTLPVFKQALTQAVLLKRQRLQRESLRALEERTGALAQRSAQSAAALAGAAREEPPTVSADTLTASRRTILEGIDQTRKLQQERQENQREGAEALSRRREEYQARLRM